METNYDRINPGDRDAVLWLQMALAKVMPGPGSTAIIGDLGGPTEKALRLYQMKYKLPVTGVPDELTLQKINEELRERGLTI